MYICMHFYHHVLCKYKIYTANNFMRLLYISIFYDTCGILTQQPVRILPAKFPFHVSCTFQHLRTSPAFIMAVRCNKMDKPPFHYSFYKLPDAHSILSHHTSRIHLYVAAHRYQIRYVFYFRAHAFVTLFKISGWLCPKSIGPQEPT